MTGSCWAICSEEWCPNARIGLQMNQMFLLIKSHDTFAKCNQHGFGDKCYSF